MRAFLARSAPRRPRLALDLGCGPGHTTETMAALTEPERVVGLDISPRFLERARERAGASIEFVCHDVTTVPFPVGPADLIFARLLLSHLAEPEALVARWTGELAPGGVLLVEEVEGIETELGTFARYLALVEERIRKSGGELYVGARLAALADGNRLLTRSSEAVRFAPATADAATMFRLNLGALRSDGRLGALAASSELDRLERELDELMRSVVSSGEIVWTLRQIVFASG
jgi:trans-aconitate methyltransferase